MKASHQNKSQEGDLEIESKTIGLVKEQIGLIGLLVLFIGVLHTDAYYARLSIRYQDLDVPALHLVYRGLTSLADAPILLLPYIGALAWLASVNRPIRPRIRFLVNASAIPMVLIAAFFLARWAGVSAAEADMVEKTCRLPRIVNLEGPDTVAVTLADGYRLLLIDHNYLVMLRPQQSLSATEVPNIKRIALGEIHVLDTIK